MFVDLSGSSFRGPSWMIPRLPLFVLAIAAAIGAWPVGEIVAQSSGGQGAQPAPIIELRLAREASAPGFVRMEFLAQRGGVYVAKGSILSDDDIKHIHVERTAKGLLLDVHYSPEAGARLREATAESVGRLHIAVLIKSRLAIAAPIMSPAGALGQVTISLDLPPKSAEEIAASIAARWPQ
jgi:hypothetical protein